jgi:molecular chaperone IbpA
MNKHAVASNLDRQQKRTLETGVRVPNFSLPDAVRVRLDIENAGSFRRFHAQIAHMEDLEMRTNFDFSPYRRSTVGFDRLFNLLETASGDEEGYPPFDIVKDGEDSYRITLAVAGFRPNEIEVVAHQNLLIVTGKRAEDDDAGKYLHRGIAARAFERRFQLADFIETGSASFDNGLLTISLKRVLPETMKPRRIEIGSGTLGSSSATSDRIEGAEQKVLKAA